MTRVASQFEEAQLPWGTGYMARKRAHFNKASLQGGKWSLFSLDPPHDASMGTFQ